MMEHIGRTYFYPPKPPRWKKKPVRKNHVFQKQNLLFHHCGGTQKMDQFSCRPSGTFDSNCALETAPTRSWNEKKMWRVFKGFEGWLVVLFLFKFNPWRRFFGPRPVMIKKLHVADVTKGCLQIFACKSSHWNRRYGESSRVQHQSTACIF